MFTLEIKREIYTLRYYKSSQYRELFLPNTENHSHSIVYIDFNILEYTLSHRFVNSLALECVLNILVNYTAILSCLSCQSLNQLEFTLILLLVYSLSPVIIKVVRLL